MKKMILLLLIGAMTFSSANAQQTDTIKSGNGTTIINITTPEQKKQVPPKRNVQPPPAKDKANEFTFILPAQESFLSNNGVAWWLIILSLCGMGMFVSILFLIGRNRSCGARCNCGFNNCNNGCVQQNGNFCHAGNVSHNGTITHTGIVEHHHTYPDESDAIILVFQTPQPADTEKKA